MLRAAAMAGLIAFASASATGAQAQTPCPAAPSLENPPQPPADAKPSWAGRAAALRAERAWSERRTAYGACRRAEIQAMGEDVNALAAQANALVQDWNALDRKVRAARTAHAAAMRAFAERRGRAFEEVPSASGVSPPPCPLQPSSEGPPTPPDPASASASEMMRADQAFQAWLAPREDYLACRKVQGGALVAAANAARSRYEAARKDYANYRKAFNATLAAFEAGLGAYTRKLAASERP